MLTKILANFYFLLIIIAINTECYGKKSSDQILVQTHELEVDALPSYVPITPDQHYLIKSIKYAEINLEAKEATEQILFFNGSTFYDFQLWVIENDTISTHLHYGNTVNKFPEDKSKGISIPLAFKAGEKKKVIYSLHDLGFAYNDSFSLKSPNELEKYFEYERYVKIICRTLIGILLSIGIFLGFYFRKIIFLYYFISTLTGLAFIEAEYGFLVNLIPDDYNSKFIQAVIIQFHHLSYFCFYYSIIFNCKGLDKRIPKTMRFFMVMAFSSIIGLFIFPQESPIVNTLYVLLCGTGMTVIFSFITYILYKGYKLKLLIVKPIIYAFILNGVIIMAFSGLANFGIIQKNEISRTIFFYLFTFNALYYISVILYKYYRLIQDRKQLLHKYNNVQRNYSLALMEGQEDKKNRIGRELHDHIGANLALIDKMGGLFKVNKSEILSDTIRSLDDMIYGLNPKTQKNFDDILLEFLKQYQAYHLNIQASVSVNVFISPAVQKIILCIIQELLSNALKHSQADNVFIEINEDASKKQISLFYMDDGVGFASEENYNGSGIKNMKSNIEKLNGKMFIERTPNGTKISFVNAQINALSTTSLS
ncbi:ATP-binding protein [Flammeovirga sp. EKP202]|uniref:sensor histidine kinase n=1 Tax=Flammeovirga sp. EKP202 TaxID=2770592 RepID=UPI00165FF954|nr:ATP-binding protein [Flammeovirga sp. EKP202]MBD0401755.1 hypothetical protein [Flammeovirga sp. EKP202]